MTLTLTNLHIEINKKTICKNFNVTLQPGEIWCLLGKNGAGKTSFLQSLCGIRPLKDGIILFNDTNLLTMPAKTRAKIIGMLQQEHDYIFPASVQEIVAAGRHPHDTKIIGETKADASIITAILAQLDLVTLAEKNIMEVSGGERRRAAIGTLLAQMPKIYLLDEPSNHLDIHYQIKILEIFKHIADTQQKTMIMVTHDLNLAAKYADKIMLLFDDGSIVCGDKKELLTASQLSQLYNHPIQHLLHEERDYFFV